MTVGIKKVKKIVFRKMPWPYYLLWILGLILYLVTNALTIDDRRSIPTPDKFGYLKKFVEFRYDNNDARYFIETKGKVEEGRNYAQFDLGCAYFYGIGTNPDKRNAVKWWKLAAANGDVYAQYNMARAYSQGDGVAKNIKEAIKRYSLVVTQTTKEIEELEARLPDVNFIIAAIPFGIKSRIIYLKRILEEATKGIAEIKSELEQKNSTTSQQSQVIKNLGIIDMTQFITYAKEKYLCYTQLEIKS